MLVESLYSFAAGALDLSSTHPTAQCLPLWILYHRQQGLTYLGRFSSTVSVKVLCYVYFNLCQSVFGCSIPCFFDPDYPET